ncbi:predicted protein [Chaetomium globosum CBS 148.51]|uniref:Uncharacterized protein n=1 Tax=Chaetomium globosum (strain ATCC 6205 / CBS 148.51 / DSM 1962 / NBRC 6347 / NRRL 1970) TaxID=306901 RepID=Q2HC26_CHAGB|nr:uncharacterized protein CHGG_02228 [Chaetomium globosum CBS 148.51]EAQ90293.1 predicted protein [Chaetomium globosum CBS 148.51]
MGKIAVLVVVVATPNSPNFSSTGRPLTETTLSAEKERPGGLALDRIFLPLRSVGAGLPGISVDGLGGIIESAHGVFHSVRRLDFMEAERTMYFMPSPGIEMPQTLHQRDFERYENELFDLSKYNGTSGYLTAMAWTEEALSGSITLYRVLFGEEGETVGIRPVAAMRDVPSPVLARMRTDERIKRKAVVTLIDDDDRTFDWKSNPSTKPRYVRLPSPFQPPSRSHSRHGGGRLADGDGVCATIPQFFALLHARGSILEHVNSAQITETRTEDGSIKPMVFLTQPPRSSPHEGNRVHVAILVPNDALWAEEEIIWTGQNGLAEFRQRQYWDLIKRASRRATSKNRGQGGESNQDRRYSSGSRSRSQTRGRSGSRSRW